MNEEKLFKLIEQYIETLEQIHKNRRASVKLTKANKKHREELEFIKLELGKTITGLNFDEKSLYRLFMDHYGKIDKRFHYIYKFFFKKPVDKTI